MVVKVDVVEMFPQSKYVLLIKDGRTVAYSLVSRNVTVGTEMWIPLITAHSVSSVGFSSTLPLLGRTR